MTTSRHTLRFHRQLTKPVLVTKAEIMEDAMVLFRGKLQTAGIGIRKPLFQNAAHVLL